MSTQYPDLFASLAAPFEPNEVKARTQGGKTLHYITARTAMNRLDDVLGPENWQDNYMETKDGLMCMITATLPDGRAVTKCDGGGFAGMSDSDDDEKSAYSSAFKRAAVKFGVGRYLYKDGVPEFAQERGAVREEGQSDREHRARQAMEQAQAPYRNNNGGGERRQYDGPPKSGKAMFAWTKDQEQRYEVGLLKYLNEWARLQEFPARMVDWDADQVALAHAEALRKLESVGSSN